MSGSPSAHRRGVCIVVPQGSHRPQAIAAAIRRFHPGGDEAVVGAIWCGDPQRRPSAGDVNWWDAEVVIDEAALVAIDPHRYEWLRMLDLAERRLGRSGDLDELLVLWAGAVAVIGAMLVRGETPHGGAPPP